MAVQNLDKEDAGSGQAQAPKKKSSMVMIIVILLSLLVLGGGGAGAYFYFGKTHSDKSGSDAAEGDSAENKEAKRPKGPPVYYAFDPAFIVNFQDSSAVRFLQVTVEVMSYDPLAIEALKTHMPVVRNGLVFLLSNQSPENIMSREGKEKIRADSLKEIQKIMKEKTGSQSIEAVYFTGFVMQ